MQREMLPQTQHPRASKRRTKALKLRRHSGAACGAPYLRRRIRETTAAATPPSARSDKEVGSGTATVTSLAKRASRTTDKANNAKPVKKSTLRLIFIMVMFGSSCV